MVEIKITGGNPAAIALQVAELANLLNGGTNSAPAAEAAPEGSKKTTKKEEKTADKAIADTTPKERVLNDQQKKDEMECKKIIIPHSEKSKENAAEIKVLYKKHGGTKLTDTPAENIADLLADLKVLTADI